MVETYSAGSFALAALSLLFDMFDVIVIFAFPNWVHCKSVNNLISCFFKLIGFGCVWGVGTYGLCSELETAICYNEDGMDMVAATKQYYIAYACFQMVSGLFSMIEAPISALYGGKLKSSPHVKSKDSQITPI